MVLSDVPEEVLRHAAAVLTTLVMAFACTFAVLWARERRRPPAPRWTGPISLAWAATLGLAVLLILCMFLGLRLHRLRTYQEAWTDPGGETADRTLGWVILKISTLLLPLLAALVWSIAVSTARRRASPPGRHGPLALCGLLLSAAALLTYLALYGRLWK